MQPPKKRSAIIKSVSDNMNLASLPGTEKESGVAFPTAIDKIRERVHLINPVQYSATRNFINGAVTYLSPYISRGVISVKQLKEIVFEKDYQPYQLERFLQELAWREYFQRVWQHLGDDIWKDIKHPQPTTLHHQMINGIENANTGINAVDDAIKNLYSTGYMHNHLRMYTASLTCNIGKAHWLQASKWMYYHLLDGDIASNNCSWQWVAGAFASKQYYFNQENVNKYTFSDQQHSFLDTSYEAVQAMPLPESLQDTNDLSLETKLPVTELPVLDISKPTLIYNSYNLDAGWRKTEDVNRILLLEPSHFKKYPVSEKVIQFVIELSKNIKGIQIYTGEIDDQVFDNGQIISKEHPAFVHYPGTKDSREWMFPEVRAITSHFSLTGRSVTKQPND